MNNMESSEHHDDHEHHEHVQYVVNDRVKYTNPKTSESKEGVVTRIRIFGMKPCCAIEVEWDDSSIKKILRTQELENVVKL